MVPFIAHEAAMPIIKTRLVFEKQGPCIKQDKNRRMKRKGKKKKMKAASVSGERRMIIV